jgi:hypothetical protein
MFPPRANGRTRWVVGSTAALILVGASMVVASPAHASTSVTDGFEGNPYDRWTVSVVPGFSLAELTNHQRARSGANVAWLEAYPPSVYSARVYRSLTLDRPGGGPAWCFGEGCQLRADRATGALVRSGGVRELRLPDRPAHGRHRRAIGHGARRRRDRLVHPGNPLTRRR